MRAQAFRMLKADTNSTEKNQICRYAVELRFKFNNSSREENRLETGFPKTSLRDGLFHL